MDLEYISIDSCLGGLDTRERRQEYFLFMWIPEHGCGWRARLQTVMMEQKRDEGRVMRGGDGRDWDAKAGGGGASRWPPRARAMLPGPVVRSTVRHCANSL